MANKRTHKIPISGPKLQNAITAKGYSIRRLAKEPEIERTEKSLRNAIKSNEITAELLFRICHKLELDINCFIELPNQCCMCEAKGDNTRHKYSELIYEILSLFNIEKCRYDKLSEQEQHELYTAIESDISLRLKAAFTLDESEDTITPTEKTIKECIEKDLFLIDSEIRSLYAKKTDILFQNYLERYANFTDLLTDNCDPENAPIL